MVLLCPPVFKAGPLPTFDYLVTALDVHRRVTSLHCNALHCLIDNSMHWITYSWRCYVLLSSRRDYYLHYWQHSDCSGCTLHTVALHCITSPNWWHALDNSGCCYIPNFLAISIGCITRHSAIHTRFSHHSFRMMLVECRAIRRREDVHKWSERVRNAMYVCTKVDTI